MSNEWALLQHGRIITVITTALSKAEVQKLHPQYDVQPLYSLPLNVCEQYEYWSSRP